MTPTGQGLSSLLTELRDLAPPDDGPVIDELRRRLGEQVLRVLVAGEAKRGKSTLVNALIGRDVLPTGVTPVTAVPTTVRFGDPERVVARFGDGTTRSLPLAALADLVTERGNPANERGVAEVEVLLPLPVLDGVELVDTPGVGSVHAHNTAEAEAALRRMDAAVVVLTADPPISASERAFLGAVRAHAVRVLCVLNKIDRLDPDERDEAVAFTRDVVARGLGVEVPVFPLSARTERTAAGGDKGFQAFAEEFDGYLRCAGAEDLRRSVAAHGARLARGIAETQEAVLATLRVSVTELEERLARFRAARAAVEQQRGESAAVVTAEFDRLRAETEAQAAAVAAARGPELVRAVVDRARTADGDARTVEADVQALTADRIRAVVDTWRTARAAELEAALQALEARLSARLAEQIAALRAAATDALGVDVPARPAPVTLLGSRRFSYAFAADPGPTEVLTTAVRTRLPGALGRRRVTEHAAARAGELLDKQLGRATGAFREQLAETRRAFSRELDRRFAEGAGRIAEAITAAAEARTQQQPHLTAVRARAEQGLARAQALAERFDRTSAQTPSPEQRSARPWVPHPPDRTG